MSASSRPNTRPIATAGLWRRLPALVIDAVPAMVAVALGFGLGLFDGRIFRPPHGWFWSEWLLKYWLDQRATLVVPIGCFFGVAIVWTALWEARTGRSLGGRLVGLLVVDRSAFTIGPTRALLRALGAVVNVCTLGLGYGWVLVSSYRRGWHDYIAGTVVVVKRSTQIRARSSETIGDSPTDTL